MSRYVNTADQVWDTAKVEGAEMERCVLWDGQHQVFSGFFRMPAGMHLPLHHHGKWVQILVLNGKMKVELKGAEPRTIEPGGYYFVEPGDAHSETAVEDTLLLVIAQIGEHERAALLMP